MKNFLVIYYAPAEAKEMSANATPEQMAEGMKPWFTWKEKIDAHIVDFGAPNTRAEDQDANGNWAASTKDVSGYTILKAETFEAAKELVQNHHHLAWAPGCSVGLYECASM